MSCGINEDTTMSASVHAVRSFDALDIYTYKVTHSDRVLETENITSEQEASVKTAKEIDNSADAHGTRGMRVCHTYVSGDDIHHLTNLAEATASLLGVGTLAGALTRIEHPVLPALLLGGGAAAAAHVFLYWVSGASLLGCLRVVYSYL
jgi:hypothetical protein